MGMNSTDPAANRAKDEAASRTLVSIRPFFIVKELHAMFAGSLT